MSGVSEYCWEKVAGDMGDSGLGTGTTGTVVLVLLVVVVTVELIPDT